MHVVLSASKYTSRLNFTCGRVRNLELLDQYLSFMATQPQEPYLPIAGEGAATADSVQCTVNCDEVKDGKIKQSTALQDVADQSLTSIGVDHTKLVDVDAADLFRQPALKRLRCRVLQLKPPLVPSVEQRSDDNDELLRADKNCAEQCTSSVRIMNHPSQIAHSSKVEEQESAISKAESEATAEEEELELCVTPTAKEQRIPESKNLVCPPPPIKKKATALKRRSRPYIENGHQPANLLINPPDLHTFPECIRALFKK